MLARDAAGTDRERLNRLIGTRYAIRPYAKLPVPYQLAIAWYMAIDGCAWAPQGLPDGLTTDDAGFREAFEAGLPDYVQSYGDIPFGIVSLSAEALKEDVMLTQDIAESFTTFDDYHRWYVGGGVPRHPEKDRWPVILSSYGDESLQDGWHRFHSYVRDGVTEIPAVFYPGPEHLKAVGLKAVCPDAAESPSL